MSKYNPQKYRRKKMAEKAKVLCAMLLSKKQRMFISFAFLLSLSSGMILSAVFILHAWPWKFMTAFMLFMAAWTWIIQNNHGSKGLSELHDALQNLRKKGTDLRALQERVNSEKSIGDDKKRIIVNAIQHVVREHEMDDGSLLLSSGATPISSDTLLHVPVSDDPANIAELLVAVSGESVH